MCFSQPTSQETVTSGADNHINWVRPAQHNNASNAAAAAAAVDDDDDGDNTDAAFCPQTNKDVCVWSPMCVYCLFILNCSVLCNMSQSVFVILNVCVCLCVCIPVCQTIALLRNPFSYSKNVFIELSNHFYWAWVMI